MLRLLYAVWVLLLYEYPVSAASKACPPLGAVLPALRQPSQNHHIRSASAHLIDSFKHQFTTYDTTFISISVESVYDHERLLDVHHTPSLSNPVGTAKADSDTVYRIGSISKLFTVLALLLQHENVRWESPVTDYVPELLELATDGKERSSDITAIRWTEVTIEALASQLAGVPRECKYRV